MKTATTVCGKCGAGIPVDARQGACPACLLETGLGLLADEPVVRDNGGSSSPKTINALGERVPPRAKMLGDFGDYELLEEIGRGGQGVVYRARQKSLNRTVALKVIGLGPWATEAHLKRFRREAEAAASLEHPGIVPIHEVGERDGCCYFSMKFIEGGQLDEVVRRTPILIRQAAELIAKVARTVHYAHEHGILHRDIKPGNILLDQKGEAHLTDFGLAGLVETESTVTRTKEVLGTPSYMAPEQAVGETRKLTSATDVYGLGAVLYQLLTGQPPFAGGTTYETVKLLLETEPRQPRLLNPKVDRDLSAICLKCLEKDPKRRYPAAAGLAEDLEHWLKHEPVQAKPSGFFTHAQKWVRRNPALVGTAAACLLLGAASLWLLREPGWTRQISAATKKLLLSPEQAAEQSKLRRALIQYPEAQIEVRDSHFMQTLAGVEERLYPILATGVGLDVKVLTDKLPKFSQAVKREPDASSYERACAAYLGKDYAEAERLSLTTADEAQKASPTKTVDIIRALKLAGLSARKLDEFVRAREHLAEAEKLTDRQRNPAEWADVQYAIANVVLANHEHPGDAEKLLRAVTEVRTQIFGPEDRETLKARRRLALSISGQDRYPEAEAELREVAKLDEKMLGPENAETLSSRWDLAMALSWVNKSAEALIESEQILKLREKVLGPEHRDTLASRNGVAVSLSNLGRFSEAIPQLREVIKVQEKVLGPDDEQTLKTIGDFGYRLAQSGEYREGESMLRRAYNGLERRLGPTHNHTLFYRRHLVMTLAVQDKDVEAEAEAREIMKIRDRSLGAEREGWPRDLLGVVLDKQGKHKEAEVQIRQGLGVNEKAYGIDSLDTRDSRGNLARNLWYQGRNAEAETLLRELIRANEKVLGVQVYLLEPNVSSPVDEFEALSPLECRTLFANTLRDQRKYAEAEAQYKEVIHAEENALGPEHRDTLNACYNFAYQLGQQGKRDQAKALAERAAKGAAKVLDVNDPLTREYAKFLEELESGHAITMPAAEFRKTFVSGNKVVEQGPR
jgi:tetratricopeptide (TPR) repeat protein/predicted Ser/Thr protein kinase